MDSPLESTLILASRYHWDSEIRKEYHAFAPDGRIAKEKGTEMKGVLLDENSN